MFSTLYSMQISARWLKADKEIDKEFEITERKDQGVSLIRPTLRFQYVFRVIGTSTIRVKVVGLSQFGSPS